MNLYAFGSIVVLLTLSSGYCAATNALAPYVSLVLSILAR